MTRRCPTIWFSLVLVLAVLILLPAVRLSAQTTGKLEGIVRDADTQVPLAGAQVSVEGTRLGNVTDDEGRFFILGVPAGLHDITARLIGYREVTIRDERVLAGQTHGVTFDLESTVIELPGEVVEGERDPLIPRDNTVSKHRITYETTQALPVDRLNDLITLQAGVLRNGGGYSIRGGRTDESATYIDGVRVGGTSVPEFGIEEVDVITGGYSPEFGDAQSGVINIVTREGPSAFSGKLRLETDEINPSSSNYGYNLGQISLGGPVPSIDHLSFFFSGEVVGKGDRSPRADGFKGTTGDLFEIADRFSHADETRRFLGHDLDIAGMMHDAERVNPDLPLLNISDSRRRRFGGRDYEGRRPGTDWSEYRVQGKIAYQPTKNSKLIGTYLEEREQGLDFSRARIFWTEDRNQGRWDRSRLGIIGYDQTLSESAERGVNLSFRGSYQRNRSSSGSLFAPHDTSLPNPGASLGYHSQASVLNFRFHDIPIFSQDIFVTDPSQAPRYVDSLFTPVQNGNTPFGLPGLFWDPTDLVVDNISNSRETITSLRLDFDSQWNRVHRIRGGAEGRFWDRDRYSSALSNPTFFNFNDALPELESFYIEDRLDYRDLVIDLGFRVESFDAGVRYPSILGDQSSPHVAAGRKTEVAPRLGVAHPVTDRTQVRLSYGTKLQKPGFGPLYDNINVDIGQQGNTNAFFGNPDLGFQKTTSFEMGFSALLADDWLLDIVGYNRDTEGNVAARYLRQEGSSRYLRIYTNVDHGNVRGVDTTLRKRFNDYFSTDLTYTMISTNSTGTDPNDFVNNEGFFVVGDTPPIPPVQPAPNNFDQRHTFNAQFNLRFPRDFREGSGVGRLFRDTGVYFTFQANSGRPYTRQDDNFDYAEEINRSRRGWESLANLRVTRDFTMAGLEYSAFLDVRNLFDTINLSNRGATSFAGAGVSNGVYQTTGSPYTDGHTVSDAIDYLGISVPEFYVSPNDETPPDFNDDGERNEADRAEIVRRLDFNGDGVVTVDEELAMAILAYGAQDADPENFDIPRLLRVGLEVRF